MKAYKLITALSLTITMGLLVGNIYAQESGKAETKVKLITEKNGKQEVFEKTIPGIKNNFSREDVEVLFGVKKADYDKFMISIVCSKTVMKDGKDGDNMKVVDAITDNNDINSEDIYANADSDKNTTKIVVITTKNGKTEKKIINHKGKMSDAEIETVLKENDIDTKGATDGNVIEMGAKKVIIKTNKGGKLSNADMKRLKEEGVDVTIDEEGANSKVIRKTVIVKLNLQDINKSDIENANKKGAGLSVDAPQLKVEQLSFYPNPNNGKFNLSFTLPNKGDIVVSVFDLAGREVYHEQLANYSGNYNKEIDLTQENKGTYIIQVQQNSNASTKKLVIE